MDELEEVILVEDEPALRLPQLSNDSWSDFVEELSKKYDQDDLLSTSVPQSTNAKRKFQIADNTQSLPRRCNVATNNNGVVSISSDEDENSRTARTEELSSSKDCPTTIEEHPTTNSCTPGGNNAGIAHLEEINKLDSGQLNEDCAKPETERVNNEATQHGPEPISNINSKTSNSSKNKGLTGISKKYQDIKRRTYKLTFHQILQIFDIEKSVPSSIGAIPGEPIELDFPDLDMREFVKIVKNYQTTESADDVRHLWAQIKSWLCAMKPAYGTTTNYTKYQKKLNWYITELMAQYVKFEIENSIQNENYYKLKMETLMNTVSSLLNDDVNLKILTLLRTDFPNKPSNFLDELFKKFLTNPKVRLENNNYGIYRLKVLGFQKWMHYTNRKRQDIVEIAIKEGSAYLPRLLPKNTEDPFYRVDRHVHIIEDYDKQGTRKILEENVSIDVLKATINKYLQVYESQLYDDFGYRLLRRQGLEHSQTLDAREDAMQMHRHSHSAKAITVRSDERHCNRRRTHHNNNNNNNNNSNSSRATHLPAGCDIQRNRLSNSSSPFRTNRCSCKSLVAKHQSDTSLSCKTSSSNDIISLDSTDDEVDVDNVESARESTEKSSLNTEKRNQSTQQRIVRRVRPPLQPQTVDNRQVNTIIQKTRACPAHVLRHRKLPPKKVDTIVLDSSSSEDEEGSAAPVDAAEVNNEVGKHKLDNIDDTHIEEPTTPTAQSQQQTQQQQQTARARLQSVSMPLRCALIGSVAIKPIRKEKHCIPGEVSSTTSHDIIETERLNEAPTVSCSGNLVVNNASAYENAREVGTVEILERRELRQPVVMAERCFQPGKLLLGIDYSDDENEDDVAERSREHIAAGSDVGDDDGVSNGCFIPMVGGYSKVVEEATSSTEVFQRLQSLENVAAAEALSHVEPAPVVLVGRVDRTANVAAVSDDAPTCSKYANSNATNATVMKENIQKEGALEFRRGKSLKITIKDFASANNIGRGKDTPEDRLREDMESSAPAFGLLAGLRHEDEQQQVNDENEDESSRKIAPLSREGPKTVSKETQDTHSEYLPTEDDEMAAIDQMLADIDENLRESHEFNKKYMKAKNTTGVAVKLTENVQNEHDLINTAVHNLDKNVIASNCKKIEGAAPSKTVLTHTNDEDLFLDVCEPVSELAKSSNVGSEVEANVAAMETNSAELAEDISSNDYSNSSLCEKSVEKLKKLEGETLEISNDVNSEETEEVITMVCAESEGLNRNNHTFEENSSDLDVACSNKTSKSTQENYEEEAMDGNVQNNEEIESNQESDILNDMCPRDVKTLTHLSDNTQTKACEGSPENEKRQLQDEDNTETADLEKNALVITHLQEKSMETDIGDEFPDSDINKSDLSEINAEVEVEETDITPELIAEERTKDVEVLVKPVDDVNNSTELTLSERKISSQIDVDQTKFTELVSSEKQSNIVTPEMDTELELSFQRVENIDNLTKGIFNDENVITNKNAEAEKCDLDTEIVLESRTVVDDTEDVEKNDSDKTREESPKTISKHSEKSNEHAFVDDNASLSTEVTESYSEPCTPSEFVEANEMVSVDDIETSGMYKLDANDIVEETVVAMKDTIESENETEATLILENKTTQIVEEIFNTAKEKRTVEPEVLELDLKGRDIEHHDSTSEESVNKEESTKQSQELVKKLDSRIEEVAEMVESLPLAETTSLLQSTTIIQVNERKADEIQSTDIETPMLVVKSKDMECHEVSDAVTISNEERDAIQLANGNSYSSVEVEAETEPLETVGKIKNTHEDKVLTASKIEEVTVVTEEIVKDDATNDAINETSLLQNVTKFQVNERSSDSEDITNKSPLQLELDVERAEVGDSAPNNNSQPQKVLVTDLQISNQDLPESVCITMKEGFESADVKTLPISHEIIVSAPKEIEEVMDEEVIEELLETEEHIKTNWVANQELVNDSEISTEVTSEINELQKTTETTADTEVVTDDSIEETPGNRDDSLGEQFTELNDSQTKECNDGNASNKGKNYTEHTIHALTETHESLRCKIPLENDFLSTEDEATDETASEVEVRPYTYNETNDSGVIDSEVVESLAGEEITKSIALNVVEAETCSLEITRKERKQSIESQIEEVSEIENSQTDSTIESQDQEQLGDMNSKETSVDSTNKLTTESRVVALSNSTSVITPDLDALGNVLPTESFHEDSDQNANISKEKCKVVIESSELEVKEIAKEKPSNNDVSESCGFSTADKQVEETSSVEDLQVDEENIDKSTVRANDVASVADAEDLVEEVDTLKDGAEEPAQYESDTSKIPDVSTKTRNAEEEQVEIELTTESLHENDENISTLKDLKSDDVSESEHETADTNSLNNNNTSSVAIDTLSEDVTARKSDVEIVKTCSKQKLKLKSKPHKLIKTDLLEKSTTSSSKKISKLKAVRNSKKRLLTEDASGKLRFKRRVSPCNDSNKDLDKVEEFKKAEELADNIAKLVIKENVEAETTEQCDSIKQDIESRSVEDNAGITKNQTLDDINAEAEPEMLKAEPELSEDCATFQRLPAEYNSEEILAVATLINMRNKYTSSTYMDEDNVVVEIPQEINRDEGAEKNEAIVEPGSKKISTKQGLVKKKVRFDEDNLLELMNEKYKALKKVKKSAKKIEKSRKAEGALLSGAGGGKKYVKRRLLEMTTKISTNEADYIIDHNDEELSDLKKKRGRKNSAHEEEQLTHKMDELNDTLKIESAGNENPIYPVLLTSRRDTETTTDAKLSKSTKNRARSLKCDAPTISGIEDVGSDFIVPDDEVEPLSTETYEKPPVPKENIFKVSRVCVDGTKIKFKITPTEVINKEKPVIVEKLQKPEVSVINKAEQRAIKENISEQAALMKTRKVTVKLKRVKMPLYATAISKRGIFGSRVQYTTPTDSEEPDLIVPESPTKFNKREESPTKYKKRKEHAFILSESRTKREEIDSILSESPTKSKKREELVTILTESPTKFEKRKEHEPFIIESPTKYKKSKLESGIGSSESNATNSDALPIATGNVSCKSLGKTSHRKHRAKSPNKNKTSVKRDISSELSELSTIQDTDNIGTLSNGESINIKDALIDKLSPTKDLSLESTSLENTGVAENADLLKNQDSSAKITMKSAHKKRPAKTSIEEMSPTKDLSLESTSFENTGVSENADSSQKQDSNAKITVKHKKRLAKSPSKTKSLVLPTTGEDVSTSKEAHNKKTTNLRNDSMEKRTCMNEISTIMDVTNVQTQDLSPSKDSPLAESSFNIESIVSPERLENKGVEKTKDSSANITKKASRKNRVVKSSFKIKLPISSFTTRKISNNDALLNAETTIKDSNITITKTDTSIEETSIPMESTNRKESALQETSSNKKLRTAEKLETLDVITNRENVEYKVSNLSADLVRNTPEKTTSLQDHMLSDAEIKTEPFEDIQIKEEEDSCEPPLDMAQSYLNVDNIRHAKEFILKPCDVILTEAKINEQADAHRGFRKQRNKKSVRVVETSSNRYKTRRNNASTRDILKSADSENLETTENIIPTLNEDAPIKELEVESNQQETSKVQKELQAITIREDMEKSKEPQAETRKDDKERNKDVTNAETAIPVEKEIQLNATTSRTDVETEDHASSITDNVIAELKLLSPESLQNTEDDKEQINLISCSENAAVANVVDTEKEQDSQSTTNAESICKVENTDEEQKTAQLLDSSIDIVLGNATFTKKPLTPKKNGLSSTPEAVVSNLVQNATDTVAEVNKSDDISETISTKNRLDDLTAEKVNSVLEKMLENKNNLLKDNKNQAITDLNVRPIIRRQTNTEEEGLRKSSNRSSLNSVKQISAKVPDALFADDESESSNADDSTSDEQFFAPILSLDDLLSKKDEPTADITTHTYTPTQEQVDQDTDAGQSHDGLGTPNFTVELEVETTQASDENSQSANGNRKVESQSEESGKCVASEELNAHLEETDANFSLSAIADISTIDIPSDLNINNEYPDLLDAMLFEQVRQSIDCMISGTNSAKKWSQDSFATTQAAVNFNQAETAVRTDAPPSVPNTQENDVIATNDKTVTANEDGIGIGQETFLGTISSLDVVEVPTTGFDLVGSFTIADFLSDAGSDLFAFPELDKTQSRSNSFSAESNLCETPPPPAIDTDIEADKEISNDKKDEEPIQTPTNHNTNSVACDHSYNKDINEVEKQRTKVRKKSTSSHTSTPTAAQSSTKSATPSPLNNSDMLHVFSRAKCAPKPFWKAKRSEEIKTSTPKKEETTPNTQNTPFQTPAVTAKRAITPSPITIKNPEEKQTVFSMPALELVIEQNGLEQEITATSSNNALSATIANTKTETLTNLNENISKPVDDVSLPSNPVIETVKADGLEQVLPQMLPTSAECEAVTPFTRPPKRASTPIEITEVITKPAPLIVQPIIRIQSQSNRLERIDPSSSSSQQAFPLLTPESQPNLTDVSNVSQIEVNDICRPERDSTPTLDEHSKDDYELSTPNKSLTIKELTHTGKARQSTTQLEQPPAKRLCVENVNKTITTNDIFDMLKSEEKSPKENQLAQSSTSTTKTKDLTNTKIVDSKSKQIEIELPVMKAVDANLNTNTVAAVSDTSNNTDLIPSKVESKSTLSYIQNSQIEGEKKNAEGSASNQQIVKNPTKQKYEKITPSQEPMLISKENLIALRKREQAAKNMSTLMITEHLEHLQPLSPVGTPEKCSIKIADTKSLSEKLKSSPARRVEESKEENIAPITLKITKDSLSQPSANQSDERQQTRKPVQSKNSRFTTKLNPNESSVTPVTPSTYEHTSSARSSIAPSRKQKGSNASPVIFNASPCAKSIIDTNPNKTPDNLPIAEVINRSETRNTSPCQTATIPPRTRVPTKPILAVKPTLHPQNANRNHPYQRTQTPPNTLNTHNTSKLTPQRPQSRDSLPATHENVSNKKRKPPKSVDKTTPQRYASTITTLPPSMQSRPTPSHQSTFDAPLTIADLSSIKLTDEDEAEIARKLEAYRSTLPQPKSYGAHKENKRLVGLQEEKLRLEYAENRRKAQQLRDTQRHKRKSQPETYEAHYKKFAMHSGRSEATNSSNSNNSSKSSGSASVGAGHHQSSSKQHHLHREYVNKFGEIEKLVKEENVTTDKKPKRSVPLTASTAWEPKMPTGDELIELLCRTKKS
ncbi:uncharacterized protein LOC105220972 isoform X2 [Zeugodacus cucurbitae]|nr:uncharacterized protein LOC105220972 isoform X2 [Zeugodacus cucurbitae]